MKKDFCSIKKGTKNLLLLCSMSVQSKMADTSTSVVYLLITEVHKNRYIQ